MNPPQSTTIITQFPTWIVFIAGFITTLASAWAMSRTGALKEARERQGELKNERDDYKEQLKEKDGKVAALTLQMQEANARILVLEQQRDFTPVVDSLTNVEKSLSDINKMLNTLQKFMETTEQHRAREYKFFEDQKKEN